MFGHLVVLEGWAFLLKSVWVGAQKTHRSCKEKLLHSALLHLALHKGSRTANMKRACVAHDFCLQRSGSIAGQGDRHHQPIEYTVEVTSSPMEQWPGKNTLSPCGEGADHLQEGTADTMDWRKGPRFSNVWTFISIHSLVLVYFFFTQQRSIMCLLCARHCTRSSGYKNQVKSSSSFKGSPHVVKEA